MIKQTIAIAIALLCATITFGQSGNLVAGNGEQKVVSTGMGATSEEATQDALRSAIEIAVGSMVSSTTLTSNDELIGDKILSLSKGFVRSYEVINQSGNPSDGYMVTVSAIVTREHIANTLKANGVSVNYNAGAMFAKLKEWDNLANAEKAMAKNLFGLEVIKRKNVSVYDYELTIEDPIRKNDKYDVKIHHKVSKNANWEVEYNKMLSTIDQLCYEKTVLTFAPDQKNVSPYYGGGLYIQRIQDGYDEAGQPIYIEREVIVDRSYFPSPYQKITNNNMYDNPYYEGGNGTIKFCAAENMYNQTEEVKQQHKIFSKQLTSQDVSRLNGYYTEPQAVYDLFNHTFTPYRYVVVEDPDCDWEERKYPERIIIYKFLHPETSGFIHRYATWLFFEMSHNIIFDYADKKEVKRRTVYYNGSGPYSSDSTNSNRSGTHTGYFMNKPFYEWSSFSVTWTLSEEKFSTLMGITVEPLSYFGYIENYITRHKFEE